MHACDEGIACASQDDCGSPRFSDCGATAACGEGWHIRRHLVHVSDRRAKLPHAGFRRVSLVVTGGAQNDARSLSEIQIVYIVTVQQLRDQGRGQ